MAMLLGYSLLIIKCSRGRGTFSPKLKKLKIQSKNTNCKVYLSSVSSRHSVIESKYVYVGFPTENLYNIFTQIQQWKKEGHQLCHFDVFNVKFEQILILPCSVFIFDFEQVTTGCIITAIFLHTAKHSLFYSRDPETGMSKKIMVE